MLAASCTSPAGLLDPLAHLAGDQGGELVRALEHQLAGAADDLRPAPRPAGRATRGTRHGRFSTTPSISPVSRKGNSFSISPVYGLTVAYGRAPASLAVFGCSVGVLCRGHGVILVSRIAVRQGPYPFPARHARTGCHPRAPRVRGTPGQGRTHHVRSLRRQPSRRGPRRSSSRPCAPRGRGRCPPTTTWRRPRTSTSSGTRRSATPRARPPAAGTGSCARSAGAWCPPGPRTSRSATGCSTPGWSR